MTKKTFLSDIFLTNLISFDPILFDAVYTYKIEAKSVFRKFFIASSTTKTNLKIAKNGNLCNFLANFNHVLKLFD